MEQLRPPGGPAPATVVPGGRAAPPGGWWGDAALVGAFAAVTAGLVWGPLLRWDLAVRTWFDTHRMEPVRLAARGLNHLGSARLLGGVTLAGAVILGVRLRSARPVVPVAVTYAVSYLLVGPFKVLGGRVAPHFARPPLTGALFEGLGDWSYQSYPSGHVVNSVIWYRVVVALLVAAGVRWAATRRGRLLLRVAPVVVVSTTVTYLQFHWLTDTLAAIPLGLLLDRLLTRLPWPPVPQSDAPPG